MIHISSSFNTFKIGLLAQEVEAFKMDCHHKGTAAAEMADSISTDCVHTLNQLLVKNEFEFKNIMNQSELIVNDIVTEHTKIEDQAYKYFDSCENAEKLLKNYQDMKLLTSLDHERRMQMHKSTLSQLHTSKKKE